MTGEEREQAGDKQTDGRSFVCPVDADTWGIKDVKRSNTLILKNWEGIQRELNKGEETKEVTVKYKSNIYI